MDGSEIVAGLGLLGFLATLVAMAVSAVLAVLYIFLPLAIFGIKPRLDQLIRNTHAIYTSLEALRTNGHNITGNGAGHAIPPSHPAA